MYQHMAAHFVVVVDITPTYEEYMFESSGSLKCSAKNIFKSDRLCDLREAWKYRDRHLDKYESEMKKLFNKRKFVDIYGDEVANVDGIAVTYNRFKEIMEMRFKNE